MRKFRNEGNQLVGWIDDDLVFRKKVKRSKHLLKVMNAWGIDSSIVDELVRCECKEIRGLDTEADVVYTVPFPEFQRLSVERNFVGKQKFLPLRYWKIENHTQGKSTK